MRHLVFLTALAAGAFLSIPQAGGQVCLPVEATKLLASDGDEENLFGASVGISGDTLVVGASRSHTTAYYSGAAYVYQYDGRHWVEEAKLIASDAENGDRFGHAVAVSGAVAVIGAYRGDSKYFEDSGVAYAFHFDGSNWVEQGKLPGTGKRAGNGFGWSVAIEGNYAVVGAPFKGVGGKKQAGRVYVFRYDGNEWLEQAILLPSVPRWNGRFGYSVAIAGDAVLIGAVSDHGNVADCGAAYVFRRDGGRWIEEAKLVAADGQEGDYFGKSISIFADTVFIGAPFDEDRGWKSGSAYVFDFDGTNWVERSKLLPADGGGRDSFGSGIAVCGNSAVIGAENAEDAEGEFGAAYVYRFDGSDWIEQAKLYASDAEQFDRMGGSVAMSDSAAAFGATGDDDNGISAGAAYVFNLNCFGCLGLNVENLVAGLRAEFTISGGTPGARAITVYGTKPGRTIVNRYGGYCANFGINGVMQENIINDLKHTFDVNGEITFGQDIPARLSGFHLLLQSSEQGTCPDQCMSNLVDAVVQ